MKKFRLLVAGLGLCAAVQAFAATDPVSAVVDTALPTSTVSYGTAAPFSYDLTNQTPHDITDLTVSINATGGVAAETSGCSTIAAGATCTWQGTLTPSSETATARLTLHYSGIDVPLTQLSLTATEQEEVSFVIVGDDDALLTSSDGENWTERTIPSSDDGYSLQAVAYGNGKWVAVGFDYDDYTPVLLVSEDGITWVEKAVSATGMERLLDVKYEATATGPKWVAVGEIPGESSPSTQLVITGGDDAETWTAQTTPAEGSLEAITYTGSMWAVFGSSGYGGEGILVSEDGVTWYQKDNSPDNYLHEAAYDGVGTWVVAERSDTYTGTYSGDAATGSFTWSEELDPSPSTYGLAYGGDKWVSAGDVEGTPLLERSSNGSTWTDATTIPALGAGAYFMDIKYNANNGKWYAVGDVGNGDDGIVLISTDSTADSWTAVTLPSSARYPHAIAFKADATLFP